MSRQAQTDPTQERIAAREGPDPQRLLSWYRAHRRPFPWRRDNDPYRVLVSEVMLQQTRTEVVERRFPEFLARFPDLQALAAAEEEEVVAAWSGLGYYRRARSLHASARAMQERGAWPRTARELKELPGIGDYTAAAVASIAFGEAVVVVDGNVKRLAARLSAEAGNVSRRRVFERLRQTARGWFDAEHPGDSNQALMELGATVCKPRPLCDLCPLSSACAALAAGDPEAYPVTSGGRPTVEHRWRLAVVRSGERVWLARRSHEESWLPGIYELPWVDVSEDNEVEGGVEADIDERYGLRVRFRTRLGTVRHAIGRRDIRAEVWSASLHGESTGDEVAETAAGVWADGDERARLATSSLVEKALALIDRA